LYGFGRRAAASDRDADQVVLSRDHPPVRSSFSAERIFQYFAREDSVEETWRIVQPLLDHPPDVRPYPCGSWGPEEAEALVRGYPRWQQPWLPTES
jgi:hypothetical protein